MDSSSPGNGPTERRGPIRRLEALPGETYTGQADRPSQAKPEERSTPFGWGKGVEFRWLGVQLGGQLGSGFPETLSS